MGCLIEVLLTIDAAEYDRFICIMYKTHDNDDVAKILGWYTYTALCEIS